jgi:preprotein translocase subunit Sec63
MKKSEWQKIAKARDLLQLEELASLKQIKSAYRRMSKKYHPDLKAGEEGTSVAMPDINDAYMVLLDYCQNYRFPLTPNKTDQPVEPEDWWMDRFGHDPLWGKKQ